MAVVCMLPGLRRGHVELLRDLASESQAVSRRDEGTTQKLSGLETRLGGLVLRVQFLADEAGHVVDLQKHLDAQVGEIW